MEFQELIKQRYSVRKFDGRKVAPSVIEQILAAGHIAPTGCNNQPQRILVINSDEALEKLKTCTKCHFDAPCALLVCYNKEESWTRPYDGAQSAPVDAAIVTTHLMLAAHDLGLGSCWVMHFEPQKIREAFHIPTQIEPLALLVLGYPHEDAAPLAMHEQVRPMDEVVIYESF